MSQYTIIKNEDGTANVLLLGHGAPLVAHSSHANYKAIVTALIEEQDADFVALFDVGKAVKERFQALSERVTVEGGHILLDGDLLDDSLTEQIVRFLDEGIEDWKPLVAFLENVQANSSEHSKEQLYDWLTVQEGITITSDGLIVGYKGVAREGDGSLRSIHSGTATVQRPGEDPQVINGRIPNEVGSIVTMPRSEVMHDPAASCHRGLHVGTQSYARDWARGAMLEVHVNPRDVVSVPSDAGGQKIRVCRYVIVKVLENDFRYTSALREDDEQETLDDTYDDLIGRTVQDSEGDDGVIERDEDGYYVEYDSPEFGSTRLTDDEVEDIENGENKEFVLLDDELNYDAPDYYLTQDEAAIGMEALRSKTQSGSHAASSRPHGKGGPTSQDAKGRGRNPAQDTLGRFSTGRPGSTRDSSTGRFA